MIDDGPLFKFMLARSLKRYELRLAAWPWPPSRGGADWESYLRVQFERIVLEIGVGIRKLIENNKVSTELQARSLATRWMPIRRWGVIPTRIDNHHIERFYRTDSSWQKGLSYHKFCGDLVSWVGTVCEVEDLFGPMPDFARYAERGIGRGTARVVVGADEVVGAGLLSRAMTGRCHVPTRDHADVRRGRCVPKLTVVRSGEPFIGRAVVVELVQCRS